MLASLRRTRRLASAAVAGASRRQSSSIGAAAAAAVPTAADAVVAGPLRGWRAAGWAAGEKGERERG
jgi:hypothetical protein